MKILHLLPSLEYSGAAKQVETLAPPLVEAGHDVHVLGLGTEGPWGQRLRDAGVAVQSLGWRRAFDPTPLWRLHRLLNSLEPNVIHVWRPAALRALGLVGKKWLPRAVVSRPLAGPRHTLSRLDRWLLKRVGLVVVNGGWEQGRCRELGVQLAKLIVVPPGVMTSTVAEESMVALPPGRRVACIGPLEAHKGIRDAIWTMDILAFVFPDVQLLVVGEGPDEQRLRRFAGHIRNAGNVHFLGSVPHVSSLLNQVVVCWTPSLAGSGTTVALEAQAAGCPVIASATPLLREVVEEGKTGLLAPPGDKVALGRRTYTLLVDEGLRRRLAQAGQDQVRRRFSAAAFVERSSSLYQQVA